MTENRDRFHVPKTEAAVFFDVSVKTIDAWLRKGMPYVQRGGPGKPWLIDLRVAVKWRNKKDADSSQKWSGSHTATDNEHFIERPDHLNGIRLFTETAVSSFLFYWFGGDMARAVTGYLHEDMKLSKIDAVSTLQFLLYTLTAGAADWVVEDYLNECIKESENGHLDVDDIHNKITGDNLTTRPPTDPDMVKFQLPPWLTNDKETIVKQLWGEQTPA